MFIETENLKLLNKHRVLIIDNTKVLPIFFPYLFLAWSIFSSKETDDAHRVQL
jgi:hypothetical protein